MGDVTLSGISKSFGNVQVIPGLDLSIHAGEFVVFVGPSGCGKSTLLRMIAGLEEPASGTIEIAGRDVTQAEPADRQLAMVFQTYALYPHMNVAQNMEFGLEMAKMPKAERLKAVKSAAEILQITETDGSKTARVVRRPAAARCDRARYRAQSGAVFVR